MPITSFLSYTVRASYFSFNTFLMNLNVDLKKNENLMTFSLAYLNVNLILIFLSMVHEYAYFYEYIWKMVYCMFEWL